jgi:2Fe-2S ferredoxin
MGMDSTTNMKLTIEIETNGSVVSHSIVQDPNKPLLEILNDLHVSIDQSCGGNGTCGTCLYRVVAGFDHISEMQELESEIAADRRFLKDERLACQSYVFGDIKISI